MVPENKHNRRYKQIKLIGLQNNRHPSQYTVQYTVLPWSGACGRQIREVRWTSFCFPAWRASWKAHVLQTWRQSKNVWQRFCDRFLKRSLLTVSRSFMNVANSVLWRMAIILKASQFNLLVSPVVFVFWYHSPNVLDTPRMSVIMMSTMYTICDYKPHSVSFLLSQIHGTHLHRFLP
jgi:hypothetical protein